MKTSSRHLGLWLALMVAAAGCSNAGATKSGGDVPTDPDFATVMGIVLDDVGLPVPSAEVGAKNLTTSTASDGTFRIIGVPPGKVTLVATKVGYVTGQKVVEAGAGQIVENVELVLRPIPVPAEPFVDVLNGKGFLSCAATISGWPLRGQPECAAAPNHKHNFPFVVDMARGLVGLVEELSWTPTSAVTGQELRLGLTRDCSTECDGLNVYLPYVHGKSPLRKAVGNASAPFRDGLPVNVPVGLNATASVGSATPLTSPEARLAFQQPIEFYVSVFYNRDVPADYALFK